MKPSLDAAAKDGRRGGGSRRNFACVAIPPLALSSGSSDDHDDDDDDHDDSPLSREERLDLAVDRLAALVTESKADVVIVPPLVPATTAAEILEAVEPLTGPTFAALSKIAKQREVYLGTTILEAEARNLEVYSTFILIGPDGNLVGTVRNASPVGKETLYVKAAHGGSHLLSTEYGNVAVGLGWENKTSVLTHELDGAEHDAALIVQMGNGLAEDTSSDTAQAFAAEYGCPVVSVTANDAAIVGTADGKTDKKADFVRATVTASAASSSEHHLSHDEAHQHQATQRWNPLLPQPSSSTKLSLSVVSCVSQLRYGLSIRRRLAAAKVLDLKYDPRPLLSCYASMLLLVLAFAVFLVSWTGVLEVPSICDAVKSWCHGLCVPFLLLQVFVHALSHVMHVFVLADPSDADSDGGGGMNAQETKAKVYHPSVGCLGVRILLPSLSAAGAGLLRLRSYKRSNPWGYLAACVGLSVVVTLALAAWEISSNTVGVDDRGIPYAEPSSVELSSYAKAIRHFAVPFVLVQILVNASTHALYGYVTKSGNKISV